MNTERISFGQAVSNVGAVLANDICEALNTNDVTFACGAEVLLQSIPWAAYLKYQHHTVTAALLVMGSTAWPLVLMLQDTADP